MNLTDAPVEEIRYVKVSELEDFKNHPFHVEKNMELYELMKSIEQEGVASYNCKLGRRYK